MIRYTLVLGFAAVPLNFVFGGTVSIARVQGLSFGKFASLNGGTVSVSPNGTRTTTGTVILVSSGQGSAATFDVSADPGGMYTISLPSNGTVSLSSNGNTMAVNDFVSLPSGVGDCTNGISTLLIGATLVVGANQPAGTYTGVYSVTVTYN